MVTDDERREVASALRTCTPTISYKSSDGGGWAHLCDIAIAVGLTREKDPSAWELAQRLADLIEPESGQNRDSVQIRVQKGPECDREALLALADELEKCAWYFGLDFDADEPLRDRLKEASEDFAGCARRIREACGEVVE